MRKISRKEFNREGAKDTKKRTKAIATNNEVKLRLKASANLFLRG